MKKSSFIELQGKQKRRLIQYLDVKVTMENKGKPESSIDQLLEQVDISKCMNDSYDSIILNRLLIQLQLHYNIPLEDRQVYYFFPQGEVFINCGVNPIGDDIRIDLKQIDLKQYLHIKTKNLGLMHIDRLMHTQTVQANADNEQEEVSEQDNQVKGKRCRRTKQRRIGHIIEKVIEWRKYYSGTSDESRQHQKYSLEQAAKKVGISKKSLDDYLFQIRFGNRYNFNFNEHYNEKVGILRDFVRQQKKVTNKGETKRRKKAKAEDDQE